MMRYREILSESGSLIGIFCITNQTTIPLDEANTDYQMYQQWLADGNTPESWNPEA